MLLCCNTSVTLARKSIRYFTTLIKGEQTMKLRFNIGAIIRFNLANGKTISGKILNVYDDEVEILEQIKVVQADSRMYYPDRTLDGNTITHLNRQLIESWLYETPFAFSKSVAEDGRDWWTGLKYTTSAVNFYDPDGTFKGDGKWCGDIEEHYSSALAVFNVEKEDD